MCMLAIPLACSMEVVNVSCSTWLMAPPVEAGGLGGEAPWEAGGLERRRPPNDQCVKCWVRVELPVRLRHVQVRISRLLDFSKFSPPAGPYKKVKR